MRPTAGWSISPDTRRPAVDYRCPSGARRPGWRPRLRLRSRPRRARPRCDPRRRSGRVHFTRLANRRPGGVWRHGPSTPGHQRSSPPYGPSRTGYRPRCSSPTSLPAAGQTDWRGPAGCSAGDDRQGVDPHGWGGVLASITSAVKPSSEVPFERTGVGCQPANNEVPNMPSTSMFTVYSMGFFFYPYRTSGDGQTTVPSSRHRASTPTSRRSW